jgi:hypothetical protein
MLATPVHQPPLLPELLQFFTRTKNTFSMFGLQNMKEAFSVESSKEFDYTEHAKVLGIQNSH